MKDSATMQPAGYGTGSSAKLPKDTFDKKSAPMHKMSDGSMMAGKKMDNDCKGGKSSESVCYEHGRKSYQD